LSQADLPWVRETLEASLDEVLAQAWDRPLRGVSRRVLTEEVFEVIRQDVRAGDAVTLATELEFGERAGLTVTISTPAGPVAVEGRIDRIAQSTSGDLWVEDYKTGRLPKTGLSAESLQMAVYLIVAQEVYRGVPPERMYGRYQPVGPRGGPEGKDLPATEVHAEEVGAYVARILEGARAGFFSPRPKGGEHCRTCDYARVCPVDIASRAERKGTDRPLALLPETVL
jgi:CRISPR/Cas system-associated exonuclease Cas4 (RecB family)